MTEPPRSPEEPTEWWRRDQPVSWRDLMAAVTQLTPLPLAPDQPIGRSAAFYPVVGLLLGILWWAVDAIALARLPSAWRAAAAVGVLASLDRARGLAALARSTGALCAGGDRGRRMTQLTNGWGGGAGGIAVLAVCVVRWWALDGLSKARTPALLFAPMLAAWAVAVLAHGSRALRADGRRLKFASDVGFREFAWASVISFGVLFGFGQATGIIVGVVVAVLLVAIRTGLHAIFDGVHDSLLWAASEGTLTAVLVVFALLERGA